MISKRKEGRKEGDLSALAVLNGLALLAYYDQKYSTYCRLRQYRHSSALAIYVGNLGKSTGGLAHPKVR